LRGLAANRVGAIRTLGRRSSQEHYRSDEDLYTLLSLVGVLILAIGLVCILASIYQWL
jgi:hypothetical protein